MDHTDPILLIAATSLVGIFLAPLASRFIASAAAEVSTELGADDSNDDQSRVRPRR